MDDKVRQVSLKQPHNLKKIENYKFLMSFKFQYKSKAQQDLHQTLALKNINMLIGLNTQRTLL